MTTVTIKPLIHNETQVVGIYFEKDIKLNIVLQKAVAAKWSNSKKCWYMVCSKEVCNNLAKALNGIATLDGKVMKDYFKQKPIEGSNNELSQIKKYNNQSKQEQPITLLEPKEVLFPPKLFHTNDTTLAKYHQTLILKGYSPNTIRTYDGEFSIFLQTIGNTKAESLGTERIKDYLH